MIQTTILVENDPVEQNVKSFSASFKDYVAIARPDHLFKNIFILSEWHFPSWCMVLL